MKPSDLIEAARKGMNATNNEQLSKALGIPSAQISEWKNNKKWPGNEYTRRLAQAAGLPVLEVIAELEMEHAATEEAREAWGKALARWRGIEGAALPGLLALIGTASAALFCAPSGLLAIMFIM